MKKVRVPPSGEPELRRRAEERLGRRNGGDNRSSPDNEAQRLVHELQVHQIELEMQNEELRTARAEVEEGLARYTELFDFAPIGYLTLAADETIRAINHAGARLLDKERSRLLGLDFVALLAMRDRPAFRAMIATAQDSGARESCEVQLTRGGQEPLAVRLSAVALPHSDAPFLLAFEDISERKARERQLEESQHALVAADRRKDDFLAVLSHELRNPLTPISSSLFVLGRAEQGSAQARRALEIIDRQVTHLTRLIGDLLDVTRIARGKIELQREPVDFAELVRGVVEDHRSSFDEADIRVETGLERGPFLVHGDSARLVQAVSNLLGNAAKFTPRGGSVEVTLRQEGKAVTLRIRDSGIGIETHVMPHLFEPFAQAPQPLDRKRGGLGLGLATARGLIELHGGTISLASDGPGRGTLAVMSLPLEDAPVRTATP